LNPSDANYAAFRVRAAFIVAALFAAIQWTFLSLPRYCLSACAPFGLALKALETPRERLRDVLWRSLPASTSCSAFSRTTDGPFGACNFTPARRALERPMAMARWGERAPCFPSRTWCISSRTNSPAGSSSGLAAMKMRLIVGLCQRILFSMDTFSRALQKSKLMSVDRSRGS